MLSNLECSVKSMGFTKPGSQPLEVLLLHDLDQRHSVYQSGDRQQETAAAAEALAEVVTALLFSIREKQARLPGLSRDHTTKVYWRSVSPCSPATLVSADCM
jgi:hypothetical protein